MEKYIEVLIFLAFAAFSLLSQFLNRRKKAVTRAPKQETQRDFEQEPTDDPPVTAHPRRRRPRPSSPQRTPTSLEEILRDLTGQSSEPEDEEEDYELPPYLQEKKAALEKSLPPEPVQRPPSAPQKLSDKVSLEDDGKRIKPIKTSGTRRPRKSLGISVARSLRNPESAKRAVILSEILQRKYF